MISSKETTQMYCEKVTEDTAVSVMPVEKMYIPGGIAHINHDKDIGRPGQDPFVRSHHPLMYRGKVNIRLTRI